MGESSQRARSYVMRDLFGEIKRVGTILEIPIARKEFTQNRIHWFSHTGRSNMPPSHVKAEHFHEPFNWIGNGRYRKHKFGMRHETKQLASSPSDRF